MKKLNKSLQLSTKFSYWYSKNKTKDYKSTNDPFYYDVLYELLIIQEGLCAYTEIRMIDEKSLETLKSGFNDGKYSIDFRPQTPAQIEHFSKLKKKSNGWDWNNLFAVYIDINHKKNYLEDRYGVSSILKPDNPSYDPLKYLMYDSSNHIFFPNSKLKKPLQDKVSKMIIVLGINNDFIKMQRREYINSIKEKEYFLEKKLVINQFITAYNMI
ncbi:MAG: hypothetical protein NTZ33_06690 [Bacteroidetes bacterium]|nr:hypothetical protein [Bacteroidota bacterium]